MKWEEWKCRLKKGKLVLLVLAAGVLLMLLPVGDNQDDKKTEQTGYSLADTQQDMQQLLEKIDGVGRCRVMLTLESSSRLTLAQDESDTQRQEEQKLQSEVLTINRGSGYQEVVVTEEIYPAYQGAVVVCDGAASSSVRLAVVETVSVLTGLGSDRISVVQWQS